jgi:hypothetical protein
MSESLNFTQFCIKYGFTSDYDITDHASLSPSGHMSNSMRQHCLLSLKERIQSNTQAHTDYIEAIISDKVIDPSGEFIKENILAEKIQQKNKAIQDLIDINKEQIKFIESLGKMSHLANGKLKKSYQLAVDDYNNQIEKLKGGLI